MPGPPRTPLPSSPTRRTVLTGLGATAAAGVLTACGTAAGRDGGGARTLRHQGWSGQVIPAELAEDLGYLKPLKLKWVGNTTSGPQDIQAVASGDVDFGGAFNGAVVKLAAAKAPVTAVISYYGTDEARYNGFYVREDGPLRTAHDLIGRRVAMNTLGAHAEAMLDTWLEREGLSREEAARVERVALPPVTVEQALRKRQIDVAVLSDILRDKALGRGGVRALFTDHALLGSFSAGTYVMTDRWLEQHPDEARTFVSGTARALEWARSTPREEVVARMERIVARRKRNEDAGPLRYWRSFGVDGRGGTIAAGELRMWADWLGGRGEIDADAVDVSELYTNRFNRYAEKGS